MCGTKTASNSPHLYTRHICSFGAHKKKGSRTQIGCFPTVDPKQESPRCLRHPLPLPPHRAIPACIARFLLPTERRVPSLPTREPSAQPPAPSPLPVICGWIQSIGHGGAPFPADLSAERRASLPPHQAPSQRCPLPFRSLQAAPVTSQVSGPSPPQHQRFGFEERGDVYLGSLSPST